MYILFNSVYFMNINFLVCTRKLIFTVHGSLPEIAFWIWFIGWMFRRIFFVKTGWPAAGPQHPSGLLGEGDSRHPSASLTLKGQIILLLRHYSLEYNKSGQAYFKYIYFYGNNVVSIQPWSENFWNLKTSALYKLFR